MSNSPTNQDIVRQTIEERIGHLVCYIEMENSQGSFTGSGFVYNVLAANDKPRRELRQILGVYIVTNRHVIFGLTENEELPTSIKINIRAKIEDSDSFRWHSIQLESAFISNSVYVHEDPNVDVAVIDISLRQETQHLLEFSAHAKPLSNDDQISNHPMLSVECTDDIIIVGFPRGFYDRINHFPIAKQGIIASAWNANFEGERFFLIDAKLFPGSSGSVVLTKPVDQLHREGKIFHAHGGKQYALLGVFSGEPYLGEEDNPEYIDLGIVWYADLIEPIIVSARTWSIDDSPDVSIGSMARPLRRKRALLI